MLRDRQEKEQLIRKFEEIVPFLKSVNNFVYFIPQCDADPVYEIHPDYSVPEAIVHTKIKVNLKTGWHSRYHWVDENDVPHMEAEGITPITNEWSDHCYKTCCSPPARMNP